MQVALGAFGAHALKPLLEKNNMTDVYETGVKYQCAKLGCSSAFCSRSCNRMMWFGFLRCVYAL